MLPRVVVTIKSPFTTERAISISPTFTIVALAPPVVEVVVIAIAPSTASVSRVTGISVCLVTTVKFPVTVTRPLSVICPSLVVAARSPPTVDVPKSKGSLLRIVAFPVPVVFTMTAPVNLLRSPRVMYAFAVEVSKVDIPATVNIPPL